MRGPRRDEVDTRSLTAPAPAPPARAPEAEPARIGRFPIVRKLGQGGMGVVYEASDPALGRRVALKLLAREAGDGREQRRLQAEAHAMARLAHPNVVTVYEVGEADGRMYIAMELVDGMTVRQWLEARRGWRDVVARFVAAARGLAAAHAAGIVHRDFKPANVMIGADGRVRVLDFGLARSRGEASEDGTPSSPMAEDLTYTGAIVGTPAYMAPEQRRGTDADAASDQFSFCVSLYEALYGVRPASGVAEREGVPKWLRRVVLRGLAGDAAARWPSMEALAAALTDDPWLKLRRRLAVLGVLALALLAAGGLIRRARPVEPSCDGAARLAGVWDADARARAQAALAATKTYAAASSATLLGRLDRYSQSFVQVHDQVCHAAGGWTERMADRARACLDRRLGELRALVAVASGAPDAAAVDGAVAAAARLTPVEPCRDAAALESGVEPPPRALVPEVAALRALVDHGALLTRGAKLAEAEAILAPVIARARALGYGPLLAEALHVHGSNADSRGDAATAEAELAEAQRLAVAAGDEHLAVDVMKDWVWALSTHGRYAQGRLLGGIADAHAERVGDPALHADLCDALGDVTADDGDLAAAESVMTRAIALRERAGDEVGMAKTLSNLASVQRMRSELDASRASGARAAALFTAALGPDHPMVAAALNNLGTTLEAMGRFDEAEASLQGSLAIKQRALGPDSLPVMITLNNLAMLREDRGDYASAERLYRRVTEVREAKLGEHPLVAMTIENLAVCVRNQGRLAEARALTERALAMTRKVLGPDHARVATVLTGIGEIALLDGRVAEARRAYEEALALNERSAGAVNMHEVTILLGLAEVALAEHRPAEARADAVRVLGVLARVGELTHPAVADALLLLGHAELAAGRPAAALPLLEHARAVTTARRQPPRGDAPVAAALARALWEAGGPRARTRARALADVALVEMAAVGAGLALERADLVRWMRSRRWL